MAGDLPHIASSTYASATHGLSTLGATGQWSGGIVDTIDTTDPSWSDLIGARAQGSKMSPEHEQQRAMLIRRLNKPSTGAIDMAEKFTRRLVKVIVVDPNENIPLADCILYNGEEKLTDLNDQELFFELDIKALLTKHNEKRTQVKDKAVKERVEYLEAAKIRDLKMVVVTIAQF